MTRDRGWPPMITGITGMMMMILCGKSRFESFQVFTRTFRRTGLPVPVSRRYGSSMRDLTSDLGELLEVSLKPSAIIMMSDALNSVQIQVQVSVLHGPGMIMMVYRDSVIWKPIPGPSRSTNPPFHVIFHGPWIWHGYYNVIFWLNVTVISTGMSSMSYLFFKKDIFGYTWYILNSKNCIWCIPGISFHVRLLAYAIPVHADHALSMS